MAEGFDVAIVGGGTAGCVIARRLAEPGDRSVVLLEAGVDPTGSETAEMRDAWRLPTIADWGFATEPDQDGGTTRIRRGRLLGGTSWLTRFAVRGHPADFDAWASSGNPGWTFDDVLPDFRKVEADHEFGAEPWHGEDGPLPISRYPDLPSSEIHDAAVVALERAGFAVVADVNQPGAVGVGRMPMSSRAGRRSTALDGWLPPDSRPGPLTIRTGSLVDRVEVSGGRVTGVRLADGSSVVADRVVVCAGTYGSPAILLRSGIGAADGLADLGIPPVVDLPGVGANLADHPAVDLDSGWRGDGTGGPILHSIATFRSAVADQDGAPDLMFWVSDPEADDPGFWLDPILMKPSSRGSVTLRTADPADPPRIRLPGLREASDVERLVEGYRLGLDLLASPALRRLLPPRPARRPRSPATLRRRVRDGAYSIPHVVGTCAMGPSPADGAVVDHLGRVHGVEGLHIADASVIPDAPSGFPHLVTLMLAEHLATRWGSFDRA